ncbi:hypothetical protein HYU50_04160 [Candidatus Woesearchaeota archaeon]|nr:hypothetical protein [Candidatus Woesearchaeota archaeon]
MARLSSEELSRLNLPQARKTLRQELAQKGYDVLESNNSFNGVATGVIVGGDFRMNHNQDFYELAGRLRLKYRPGDFYTKEE